MKVSVTVPYPLVLAKKGNKKLVLFLERPFKKLETEDPWSLLALRGLCLMEGRKLVKQYVLKKELTLVVPSFDPKPFEAEPEEVARQLLGGEGPCEPFKAWGLQGLKCGHTLLFEGRKSLPPLGFGVVSSRVDVLGARMKLKA